MATITTADTDPACDKTRITELQMISHKTASNTVLNLSKMKLNLFNLFIYKNYTKSPICDSYLLLLSL
jgi:hypothetical protein